MAVTPILSNPEILSEKLRRGVIYRIAGLNRIERAAQESCKS
jgi:hypothetical protein